jgi:dTDP-L-rhamnose 4-epimerase
LTTSSPTRVLITGGLGFIGTKIVDLLSPEHEVLLVDNLHPQVHKDRSAMNSIRPGVRFLEADVADQEKMAEAADFQPDVVFHLAAETGTGQSLLESRRHAEVNVVGTATLLDALSARRLPKTVVLPSSRAVYGEGYWQSEDEEAVPATPRTTKQLEAHQWTPEAADGRSLRAPLANNAETQSPNPANIYAATKLAQEHMIKSWCGSLGVSYAICRLQNVFGDGQAVDNPYTGVLTFMARQAIAGQEIRVFEGGDIVRDFVNVRDVATALVSSAFTASAGNAIYDIGSGHGVTLYEVADRLAALTDAPRPVRTSDFRAGDVRSAFADIGSARSRLGYSPDSSLDTGLEELLAWVGGAGR